jgi:sugar lactone lactonase YvrE
MKPIIKALFIPILGLLPIVTSAQVITTIAGTSVAGSSGDKGQATAAELHNPVAVAFDGGGNLYIADFANNKIRMVSSAGVITTVAGNGSSGSSGDGGQATAAQLNNPEGVAMDIAGNIYIADAGNNVIRKVYTSGIITTLAGTLTLGFSGDGGPANKAELNGPNAIAVDDSGRVFISDASNDRIRMIDTKGIIRTVAGNGKFGFSGDNGAATAAEIDFPYGIAVDTNSNLYIADYVNSRIRKVNKTGIISTIAGNGTPGYTGDGGQATAAELNFPVAVAVGDSGKIFTTDASDNVIRNINASGVISTYAGDDTAGYAGNGGLATAAQMNYPYGITFDAYHNLFIADQDNNVIREVIAPVGINELSMTERIRVYPIPSNGKLNMQIDNGQMAIDNQRSKIDVFNIVGENVFSLSAAHFPLSVDLSSLNMGIYILRITTSRGVFNKRIEILR